MKKRKLVKTILIAIVFTLLVLFYWVCMFYVTQSATQSNTYKCSEKIVDVEIKYAHHRGNDKLYIITEKNDVYMLNMGWRNENKSYELAKKILYSNKNCTLTVWKRFGIDLFSIFGLGEINLQLCKVVDLRNDTDIYWDIENHNSFQKSERVFGIIGGVFLSIIAIGIDVLVIWEKRK